MLFRVGLGVPQEGDLLLAGSTPTLPRKKNGARVWGTKAKPLAAYRWRLCCLNSNFLCWPPLADFTAANVKVRIAGKPSDGLWAKSPKRDGYHGGPSRIAQNLAARVHVRSPMKRKLLLAVVWIALAGGIAALIIFPPDSVLTAEFRH